MNNPGIIRYPSAVSSARPFTLDWLYSRHHTRRFEWMRDKLASHGKESISIIELGCHDARSLIYVPVNVHRYVGLDAGWQSGWKGDEPYGLEAARIRMKDMKNHEVRRSTLPEDIEKIKEQFDVALVLETFEYLEPSVLESYIAALAQKVSENGCIITTMPNEKGIPLLLKAAGARLFKVRRSEYTATQFCNALLGRMNRVPRAAKGRKGFDYGQVVSLLSRHFPFMRTEGIEMIKKLPPYLSTNTGVVAAKRPLPHLNG